VKGVTQLYAELMLLAVVVSFGGTLIYVAAGIESTLKSAKLPPKISAYRVGDTVIIANWGGNTYRVRVVCLDSETYEEVSVGPGTYLYNTTCSEIAITYGNYVITPTKLSRAS